MAGDRLRLEIDVTNTGDCRGSEVVQCYVSSLEARLFRPERELRAFQKVTLEPGEKTTVEIELGDRAFAYWDSADATYPELSSRGSAAVPAGMGAPHRLEEGWYLDAGPHEILIGRSSEDTPHRVPIQIQEDAGPLEP